MQTTLEETDKHTVRLTVEVPPEELGKDLDRAYRKIAQQVKIPGFRKGKVPRQVIDAQFGRAAVVGEFIEDSVPTYYREALREGVGDPLNAAERVGVPGDEHHRLGPAVPGGAHRPHRPCPKNASTTRAAASPCSSAHQVRRNSAYRAA